MKPCPSCKADAAKERRGTLGESKGVWCTSCGRSTDTIEAWENAWRGSDNPIQLRAVEAISNALYKHPPRAHLERMADSFVFDHRGFSDQYLVDLIVSTLSALQWDQIIIDVQDGRFTTRYLYKIDVVNRRLTQIPTP